MQFDDPSGGYPNRWFRESFSYSSAVARKRLGRYSGLSTKKEKIKSGNQPIGYSNFLLPIIRYFNIAPDAIQSEDDQGHEQD